MSNNFVYIQGVFCKYKVVPFKKLKQQKNCITSIVFTLFHVLFLLRLATLFAKNALALKLVPKRTAPPRYYRPTLLTSLSVKRNVYFFTGRVKFVYLRQKSQQTNMESDPSENSNDIDPIPPKNLTLNALPGKSKEKYYLQYNLFMDWCNSKNFKKYCDSVILSYLMELSEKYKSSTLWSIHSMLKATLLAKNGVDIGKYEKVTAFLKKQSFGYVAKQSKTFTREEINKFLLEAPDEKYLMAKVNTVRSGVDGSWFFCLICFSYEFKWNVLYIVNFTLGNKFVYNFRGGIQSVPFERNFRIIL